MSLSFWAIATVMLIVGTAFVVVPMRKKKALSITPAALLLVLIPLSALGLYALLGSYQSIDRAHPPVAVEQSANTGSPAERPLGSVSSMINGLATRLENEPGDADGWVLLARSYHYIGQHAAAIEAYERAQALGKNDVNLEALLFDKPEAIQSVLAKSGPAIRGRISLSPDVASQVLPSDTLFIFAKESREQRMPVVALRKSVADLPLDFALTDQQIMVPGTHIADYEQLVVTAKISRSGSASDDSLGLEAWSDVVSPTDDNRIDLLVRSNSGSSDD